ncbi:MAG: hypothetical protein HP496_05310 [Nitrospira sp.]|nr:hypothetical protein [Nitrospira sp.]
MNEPSDRRDQHHTEPPLWSIVAVMLIILGAPLVLYSFAPTGPIREGDTVFSEGEQQVQIRHAATDQSAKADNTCLLDPNSPLIVIHASTDQADSSIIAHVQGNPTGEWPFCSVHTEVVLKTHQVFQKPAIFGTVREILAGWFSR